MIQTHLIGLILSSYAYCTKQELRGAGVEIGFLDTMSAAEGYPRVHRKFPEGAQEVPKGSPKFCEGSLAINGH